MARVARSLLSKISEVYAHNGKWMLESTSSYFAVMLAYALHLLPATGVI